MPSVLRFGAADSAVARLVALLCAAGCRPRPPVTAALPKFGRAIENMVLYFQMTHQGPDGRWLDVDGVVGPSTWWALEHAGESEDRSFLDVGIPQGITGRRHSLLATAIREHGVREDGVIPNRGSEVDKYQPAAVTCSPDAEGKPWCAYFVSWVTREVYGKHLLGRPVASAWTIYQRARSPKYRRWLPKNAHEPAPGDAFIMLYGDNYPSKWCSGHVGFVLRLSQDAETINTIEGNCGDRVRITSRALSDDKLKGFVNIVGDRPDFRRGLLRGARNSATNSTR